MPVLLIAEADLPEEVYPEIADEIDEKAGQTTVAVKQAYLNGARASGDPLPLIPQPSWQLLAA